MKIAGVILAGGAGARMGAYKPLMPFRGATLIDAVIARVRPQVEWLALDVPKDMADQYRARYGKSPVVVPDLFTETGGPLCGVITGLTWLSSLPDADWLATVPCDTPLLPDDLVAALAAKATDKPVVVIHNGRLHGVCGLWPKSCLKPLQDGFERGALRSMRSALDFSGAIECAITAPEHAFFNVNTKDDLATAEALTSD